VTGDKDLLAISAMYSIITPADILANVWGTRNCTLSFSHQANKDKKGLDIPLSRTW